jgi:hypothetical protein
MTTIGTGKPKSIKITILIKIHFKFDLHCILQFSSKARNCRLFLILNFYISVKKLMSMSIKFIKILGGFFKLHYNRETKLIYNFFLFHHYEQKNYRVKLKKSPYTAYPTQTGTTSR